jgi:kynurenine formamidase
MFIGPACVLDTSQQSAQNHDYLLTTADLATWEKRNGAIPVGSWVLLRTGWWKRRAEEYLNLREDGPHTPGLAKECSELLAKQRGILGVGVETVGTDAGQAAKFDPPFPNHFLMHGSGKFGLAGLMNLDQLPETGAVVIAAPLKIVGGSGSPVRVIAIVPNGS